jgi:hypothetical protein
MRGEARAWVKTLLLAKENSSHRDCYFTIIMVALATTLNILSPNPLSTFSKLFLHVSMTVPPSSGRAPAKLSDILFYRDSSYRMYCVEAREVDLTRHRPRDICGRRTLWITGMVAVDDFRRVLQMFCRFPGAVVRSITNPADEIT